MCESADVSIKELIKRLNECTPSKTRWQKGCRCKSTKSCGVDNLMMIDVINLQIFALYIQKTRSRLGMNSMEANAMEILRRFFNDMINNG